MTVNVTSFRQDFPEFGDTIQYPDSGIAYWLNLSSMMLNTDRLGLPSGFKRVTAAAIVGAVTTSYAVGEVLQMAGGRGAGAALQLTVASLQACGPGNTLNGPLAVTTQLTGAYTVLPANPVSQYSSSGAGVGATFNMTYVQQENSIYDCMQEMFVAHNLVLEKRAVDSAASGGDPGVEVGAISSMSVGPASVSYDASTLDPKAGHWNQTTYGLRFWKMVKTFAAGPIQANVGCAPSWVAGGGAFGGIWNYNFPNPSCSG